jgi:hypothetical protein
MNRATPLLCPLGLIAALMLPPPSQADPEIPNKTDEKIDRILRELRDMRDAMNAQKNLNDTKVAALDVELKIMQRRLADLEQKLDRLNGGRPSNYPPEPADLRDLKEQVNRLERSIRESRYFPPEGAPAPATGTVVIRNNSRFACTVRINSTTYRVMPGETASVANVPAGTFTYEVLSDGYPFGKQNTLSLAANERRPLTIEY